MQAIFSLISKVPYEGQTYHGSALNATDLWDWFAKELVTDSYYYMTRNYYVVVARGPSKLQWISVDGVKDVLEFTTAVIRELNK